MDLVRYLPADTAAMESYSRKKEPSVISSRVILEGIEDDDADAMKASLPEHDIIRRATTVSLSYKSAFRLANGNSTVIGKRMLPTQRSPFVLLLQTF